MTEKQYKEYDEKKKRIEPLKQFLSLCGNRYHDKDFVSKYPFQIRTVGIRFFLERLFYLCNNEEKTFKIPDDLQDRIVNVIEEYVDEKMKELEQI